MINALVTIIHNEGGFKRCEISCSKEHLIDRRKYYDSDKSSRFYESPCRFITFLLEVYASLEKRKLSFSTISLSIRKNYEMTMEMNQFLLLQLVLKKELLRNFKSELDFYSSENWLQFNL